MNFLQDPQDITVLDAINLMSKVWAVKVKAETIQHCFRKAGFILEDEDDLPLAEIARREALRDQQEMVLAEDELFPVDPVVSFSEYRDVDSNVICSEAMTDSDILEYVTGGHSEDVEPEDILSNTLDDEQPSDALHEVTPTTVDKTLRTMKSILHSTDNVSIELFEHFFKIEQFLSSHYNIQQR